MDIGYAIPGVPEILVFAWQKARDQVILGWEISVETRGQPSYRSLRDGLFTETAPCTSYLATII